MLIIYVTVILTALQLISVRWVAVDALRVLRSATFVAPAANYNKINEKSLSLFDLFTLSVFLALSSRRFTLPI